MKPSKRQTALFAVTVLVVAGLAAASLCVGSYPLTPRQVGTLLTGGLRGGTAHQVFWLLRVPRTVMALLGGLALGLAGGVYQTIFRNPLASPDLTGVASGAAFGAAYAIVLGAHSAGAIMGGAFAAALAALGIVLALAALAGAGRMNTYLLAGVIVSSLADAGLMVLKALADPERQLAAIEFWTMGSLGAVTADKVWAVAPLVVATLILLLALRRPVALLALGSDSARSLGLAPGLWRAALLTLTTLLVAAVVSVTGTVAFVGLIAPHITFLLGRRRGGGYLALCALVGGACLLAADLAARSAVPGTELPLSIPTVLFGVPMLTLLLWRGKGRSNAGNN